MVRPYTETPSSTNPMGQTVLLVTANCALSVENLELVFESREHFEGCEINILKFEDTEALIQFESEKEVEKALRKRTFEVGAEKYYVKVPDQNETPCPNQPKTALLVSDVPENSFEISIKALMENEGQCEVVYVEFSQDRDLALVFFRHNYGVTNVTAKQVIQYKNSLLKVSQVVPEPTNRKTVFLTSEESNLTQQKLQKTLKSNKITGHADISSHHNGFLITFNSEKEAVDILHREKLENGQITYYVKRPPQSVCYDKAAEKYSIFVTGFTDRVHKDDLKNWFANKKISGGGPVKAVHFIENDTKAVIKFQNECDAASVLQKKTICVSNMTLHATGYRGNNDQQNTDYQNEEDKLLYNPAVEINTGYKAKTNRLRIKCLYIVIIVLILIIVTLAVFLVLCMKDKKSLVETLGNNLGREVNQQISESSCIKLVNTKHGVAVTSGNVTRYTCNPGYVLRGESVRICDSDGIWSGEEPKCNAVACQQLSITNGNVQSGTNRYGDTASYSCNVGYQLQGNQRRTCKSNGRWTGFSPTCTLTNCGVLHIQLGSVHVDYITYGGTANYKCNIGYTLHGSEIRTCQESGKWSGSEPMCVSTDCGEVHIRYGHVQSNYHTYGGTTLYTCDKGYVLQGNTTRTCKANGEWSGDDPVCKPVECGELTIQFGMVLSNSNTYGETARYKCDLGYTLNGHETRLCEANGKWSGSPAVCSIVQCGQLESYSIDNGDIIYDNATYGSHVTYSCDNGYRIQGNTQRFCQADGIWSGTEPACKVLHCTVLGGPAFGIVSINNFTLGGQATYKCNIGYNLVGQNIRTCQSDEKWTGYSPICRAVDCGNLESLQMGSVMANKNMFQGTAQYTCDLGYKLIGNNTRMCQANGRWSGSKPHCKLVNCGTLPQLDKGKIEVNKKTYKGKALYSCDTGYKLSGRSIRTCQSDGSWNGTALRCLAINCGKLRNPTFGSVITTGVTFGKMATYSCDTGHKLNGNKNSYCQETGEWSNTPPKCEAAYCGVLTQPLGGSVSSNKNTFKGEAIYTCDQGYLLNGHNKRTCQADGKWSNEAPTCSLYGEIYEGSSYFKDHGYKLSSSIYNLMTALILLMALMNL